MKTSCPNTQTQNSKFPEPGKVLHQRAVGRGAKLLMLRRFGEWLIAES
jgi:hypothetical protein